MKRLTAHLMSALVIVALLLTVNPGAASAASRQKVDRAVKITKNQMGDPYAWGAAGPNRFDCSGLIYYSYRRAGIKRVARTSSQQAAQARNIRRKNMRKGDLMFFHSGGRVYHVGVFVGWKNGRRQMVHSPKPGTRVHKTVPWTNAWYPGTYRRR